MKNLKRSITLLFVLLFVLSMVSGCVQTIEKQNSTGDTSQTPSQNTETAPKPEEPLKLKIISTYATTVAQTPEKSNAIQKRIEEYTNTDLDIMWIVRIGAEDKINTLMAAGEFPDLLLLIDEKKNQGFMNALSSGVFWELGTYFKDYPNLSTLNPVTLKNTAVDGKVYGIHRARDMARGGMWYRKDWADTLGLKMPQTIDDVYNMMYSFVMNDPDRDNLDNTRAWHVFGTGFNAAVMDFWMSAFGAPNWWGEKNGEIVPAFMTDEFMNGLDFIKKLYDNKLMNQDFPIAKAPEIGWHKIGMHLNFLTNADTFEDNALKLDPNAVIEIIPKLQGEKKFATSAGYGGLWCIPKQKVKTEVEVKKILGFFDKLCDKEMQNLLSYGIENVHYNLVDGKVKQNDDQRKLWNDMDLCFGEFKILEDKRFEDDRTRLDTVARTVIEANSVDCIPNIAYPLTSQTYVERGADLDKIWKDAIVKYVLGELDKNGWSSEIEKWRNQGGSEIIKEYTAQYEKYK